MLTVIGGAPSRAAARHPQRRGDLRDAVGPRTAPYSQEHDVGRSQVRSLRAQGTHTHYFLRWSESLTLPHTVRGPQRVRIWSCYTIRVQVRLLVPGQRLENLPIARGNCS